MCEFLLEASTPQTSHEPVLTIVVCGRRLWADVWGASLRPGPQRGRRSSEPSGRSRASPLKGWEPPVCGGWGGSLWLHRGPGGVFVCIPVSCGMTSFT